MLNLFFLNSGSGESIVIELPDGSWGVVDCYFRRDDSDHVSELLEKNGVKELKFLCLTHPHLDHFRGMERLIENFPIIKEFWSFMAPVEKAVVDFLHHFVFEENHKIEDKKELTRIFREIRSRQKDGLTKIRELRTGLTVLKQSEHDLEITAVAPCQDVFDKYFGAIHNDVEKYRRFKIIEQVNKDIRGGDEEWTEKSIEYGIEFFDQLSSFLTKLQKGLKSDKADDLAVMVAYGQRICTEILEFVGSESDSLTKIATSISRDLGGISKLEKNSQISSIENCLSITSAVLDVLLKENLQPMKLSRQNHNDASIGLLIRYGDQKILLGGDVETQSWKLIMKDEVIFEEMVGCRVLKVPHHGSKNANDRSILGLVSDNSTSSVAVVTPSNGHDLPDPEVVRDLKSQFGFVKSTCINTTTTSPSVMFGSGEEFYEDNFAVDGVFDSILEIDFKNFGMIQVSIEAEAESLLCAVKSPAGIIP